MARTKRGTNDDDVLKGTRQDNLMLGRGGSDDLDGGAGDDTIIGGDGDDLSLRGGAGADLFVFRTGDDQDQINDFSIADGDGLDLSETTFSKADLKDRDQGGDILDRDGDGNYLRETSSNGRPEVTFYFGDDDDGFDSLTIIGVSIRQLQAAVRQNPDLFDFFN